MPRRPLLLETLEDRILCSASVPVEAAPDPHKADATTASAAVAVTTDAPAPAPTADPTAAANPTASASSTATPATTAVTATDAAQLTDAQRAALESVIKSSTNQIWFQQNVGQFAEGVRYGFTTQFGAMLVYDDHLSIVSNQTDSVTGAVGLHTVDITFNGSNPWQIVPGEASGVLGSYQQPDGTVFTPELHQEITLRNVYNGVDLRLYSADQGVLEFDWLVAQAQDYEKIRLNFSGQDGINFNADGSATLDLRYQDLTLKLPEVYQVINGQKQLLGAAMVGGDTPGEMRYALSGNIVRDQPLVIDPNVAWSTYFDLNDNTAGGFDSYLFAVQVNSAGTYAAGWVKQIITNGSFANYMQVNAGFAQGTVVNQNYIYRLNTTGTAITAWTSTGVVGSSDGSASTNPATDLELFPDGRVLVAYRDATVQIYSADLATRSYSAIPTAMSTINSLAIVNNSTFYVGGIVTAANAVLIPAASGLDSVFAGASEGLIVRYTLSGATPVADWATYIGGAGAEDFTAIALTPNTTKLVFAVHSVEAGTTFAADGYSALVNAVDSTVDTVAGNTEILTGVINVQAAKPAAFDVFSLLGGSGNEGAAATSSAGVVITATNTGYYVAGNTSSVDLPGTVGGAQTTFGGGANDTFLSFIAINGSAGTGFRSSYNGGAGADIVGGIGYDAFRDRVFVFGTTTGSFPVVDTTPTSVYFDNSFGGGTYDIFISTFTGDVATRDYATYIGGTGNDYLGNTGVLLGTGHVTYSAATDQVYLATTVHSTLPANVIGAGIPGYDLTKNNGGNDVHVIFAFNINIFDHGDAPASYEGSPADPAAEAISQFIRLGATVDAEHTSFNGATATDDDTTNNGSANDEDGIASVAALYTADTTYSATVSVLNNTAAALTLQGWINFNGDGVFAANERATVAVPIGAALQNVTLTWGTLPGIAAGPSYLRLRLTDTISADIGATTIDERSIGTDLTGHGEIEDYALTILTSSIAGTVYSDANNDGAIGGAETRLAGVTVTLTGNNNLGAAVSRTTTTDASGNYTFANLRASDATGYIITETQPAGFLDGKNTVGTSGGATVNNPLSDVISGVVLAASTAATGYDFGELAPAALDGTVYLDLNNDGVQLGAGETGVNAVTVTLTGTDDLGAAVSTTATTNGTGGYSFGSLRPGTYTITETQPGALLDGKEAVGTQASGTINNAANSNTISAITLAAGVSGTANNFGDLPPSSFAGTVFIDSSNDGVQLGATETGISGATVTLTGTDDFGAAVSLTTTSNASGAYSFGTLRPGTYVITETQPAGFLDGKNTAGTAGGTTVNNPPSDIISAITLAANVAATGYNFGELAPASLAGVVYNDLNNDGVQLGAGETGITGVTVTLTGTDDLGNAVSTSTTTNASGAYSFAALRPGTYTLTETQPAGLLDGRETAGGGVTTPGGVNNAIDNNTISGIVIASGQTGAANNFGELSPASLTATAYRDVNNDGVQLGAGETGILGVTVTVTGTDDRGAAVSTALVSDASGNVSFTNLRPGTYTITETQPGGFDDGLDGNGTPAGTLADDQVSNITVVPGTTGTGYKFGELPATSISGTVYRDLNNDGLIAGASETGISGVTLTLTGINDLGAAVNVSVATDVDGNYTFTGLRPSDAAGYTLTETQPAGFLDGKNTAGSSGGTTVNNPPSDVISAVVLTAGTGATDYNFGELPPSTLSGSAYIDANNDGLFQGGETAHAGVTITLTGTNDLGTAITLTTTSALDGSYSFANLRPGTYTLTETQPAGFLDGRETAGTQGSGTVDNTTNSNTISGITLAANVTGTANNFADLRPAELAGAVFSDGNNDGLINGADAGVSSATVTLTGIDDRGIAVSTTATTNAAGAYSFGTLRPGTYTISETQPAGFLDGKDTIGTPGGTTANDVFSAITLTEGTNGGANNFAELAPGSLAGSVYIDANIDGIRQGAESGLAGVTVTLTGVDDLGNAVSSTTTTDATGAYSFGTLRPSDATGYTITETQPTAYGDGTDAIGTQGGTAGNDVLSGIVLSAGVGGTGNIFGERIVADLSITKTDGSATYTPGTAITYTVTVGNAGPSFVTGAVVADTIPANISGATWTAAYAGVGSGGAASGSGSINEAINLSSGGSATFTISGTVLATATGNLVNTATVAAPAGVNDLTPGNNSATDTDTVNPVADLSITKTDGTTTAVPGTTTTYTIVVSNTGPSFVTGATVADTLPAALTGVSWTAVYAGTGSSGAASGTGNISTLIDLAVGGTATFTVTGTVVSTATGTLVNTATVTPPVGTTDPTPGNNSATDTDTLTPTADLSITKTDGSATYTAGTAISYTVVVSNGGPSFVSGATVADTVPANVSGATWTAVYAGVGSTGVASGSGDINTAVDLASGGSVTFTITGTVLTTATGNLVNTATVAAPAGVTDPTPGNNSATDTDTPNPVADLAITKTDGVTSVVPGTTNTYTIVVSNVGPSFVTGASVADTLPAALTGVSWTAVYTGAGSSGAASGAGNISTLINLAVGGTATFTVTGTVASTATGSLVNTATVTPPVGVTDPTPGNNSATDTDTLTPTADLSVTKTDGSATYISGTAISYTVVVSNNGPSFVTGAVVADTIPANISGATWTAVYAGTGSGGVASGSGDINTAINLTSGGSATFTISGTVLLSATGNLTNTATVTPPATATDPTPGNNSATDTDTRDTTSLAGFVFNDANNDGVRQVGENGIAGATLTLTGTDNLGGVVNVTATTAADGSYSFINLRPSDAAGYTITETPPVGFLDGTDTIGTPGGTAANDVFSNIVLVQGVSGTANNFGELAPASLAGFVYNDTNNNGTVQAGENGVGGVTVTLTGSSDLGAIAPVTVTTAADGSYTFGNLRPGTYTVTETQPAGLLDGQETAGAGVTTPGTVNNAIDNNTIANITIASGQTGVANNFGELAPSSLTATAYRDVNNDGVQSGAGETGISGVTVTVTGIDDRGIAVNTALFTDASGNVSFTNLRPGTYTLTETQPAAFNDGLESNGTPAGTLTNDQVSNITVASGTTGTGYKFGELPTASISGTVYRDLNNDGLIAGAGETGISGVTVTLTGTDDLGAAVTFTATTDVSGNYTFTGLRPSDAAGYTITETQPAGFLDGNNTVGSVGGATVNNPLSDVISAVVFASGTAATDYNFGELPPSTLSGAAYVDANNDGVFQVGETAQAGVTISLTGTNDLGTAITLTTTSALDGSYSFANLRPGTYTLTETQPAGFLDGRETAGTQGSGTVDNTTTSNTISGITLTANVTGTANNFADLRPGALAGAVFSDGNNDGLINGADAGVSGATVTLTGTDDRGIAVSTTATTNAAGAYSFGTLRPGTYTLTETQPGGFLDGKDTIGTPGGTTANDVFSAITLTEGTNGAANNFAELAPSSFSGFVYTDTNNDGVKQGGETGVTGVTITLTGTDDLGNAVNLTATSDATGAYTFGNLRPSSAAGYTITETQPAGFLDGKDTIGTPGGTTADDVFSNVVLTAGTAGANNNFAELQSGTISGSTYIDANNDGVFQGGETPQAGVTITLTGTDDLGNPVALTTTSDASGAYTFGTLRPGTYAVTEAQPAGLLDGQDTAGPLGGNTALNDTISAIIVGSGQTANGNNFADLRPSSLGGSVLDDRNNDGVKQAGENGVGGVTLTLTGIDDLGNPVSVTLTTQPAGTYNFTNLRPGTYALAETTPAGFLDGQDTLGTQGGTVANDLFSNIVLTEGTTGTGNNFAELTPATVSGSVFTDANNDGLFQGGETPVNGAKVTITGTDDLGNVVNVSVTTQPDGSYTFNGLRPSDATGYTITETQPAGLLDGKNAVGTAGGTTMNNPLSDVISGIVTTAGTTPGGYNFGELRPASLTGVVFQDDSNDGVQQAGENGVAGVTVTLTGTDDLGNAVSVTTLADGSYTFGTLRPGTYALTETQPAGLLDGKDALGAAGGTLTNDRASAITLSEGQTGSGYTFGELAASSFSGTVFSDLNNNGVIDGGETGIAGVTLTLTGTDDLGNPVSATTTSAADGSYTFGGLRPGSYTLTETQPAGFLDGQNTAGTAGGTTSNNPLSDVITAITLASNTPATGYLFGELTPASFSGTVFQDLDNNGANDPTDLPIAGATITLTGTDDLGNAVSSTATSAADGSYTFASLGPGTYTLTETQPTGYLDGTDTAGTTGGTPANDTFSAITLAVGQTGSGYLFGERTPPDLVVTKTDGLATAKAGDLLTYTITVANASVQQADSVTVTDQFPSGLHFVSADNGGTFDPLTGVITWNLGAIAGSNAQTFTLTVIARVPSAVPRNVANVTNSVTATDVSGMDANPANNTATDTDRIPAAPDLYVHKTDNLATANVGQQTTYTITGGNAGEQVAEGVVITDILPPALAFVSASGGGRLTGGRVVWNLGDLAPGATFQLTVRVVVESGARGKNTVNTVSIADRYGSVDDVTPFNNTAKDQTQITTPFVFAFDSFHDFAAGSRTPGLLALIHTTDVSREALLPLAPMYSGEADPGATLVVSLYNAKGEQIGSQTVMVDAGGNWLTTFASSTMRDTPSSVRISMLPAPASLGDSFGHNLRAYFSPALNPGHFFETVRGLGSDRSSAPLLDSLGLENPLQLGSVKYGGELLSTQGTASGE